MKRLNYRVSFGIGAVLMLVWCAGFVFAIEIVGFEPKKHQRFSSGYPVRPVPNESDEFVGKGYDWSGVGWEVMGEGRESLTTRALTLVSDRHFLYSSNLKYEEEGYGTAKVKFYSPTLKETVVYEIDTSIHPIAVRHPRDVIKGATSDMRIGTLTKPLDPAHGITHYPVLVLPSVYQYRGQRLLVYVGRGAKIGVDSIEGVRDLNGQVVMGFVRDGNIEGESFLTSGDSGSPSFVPVDGKLALVGVHFLSSEPDQGLNLDCFVPAYIEQMQAAGVPVKVLKRDY